MLTFKNTKPLLKITFLVLICILLFPSCDNSSFTADQKAQIKELMGKTITFPNDLTLYSLTEQKEFSDIHFNSKKSFRMVAYIDASCGTCLIELSKWDSLIYNQNNEKLEYILILKAYDDFELFKFIAQDVGYKTLRTVILDKRETFYQINEIPYDKKLQSYLLNNDNEVIGVGNPVFSEKIMNSYKKLIDD